MIDSTSERTPVFSRLLCAVNSRRCFLKTRGIVAPVACARHCARGVGSRVIFQRSGGETMIFRFKRAWVERERGVGEFAKSLRDWPQECVWGGL